MGKQQRLHGTTHNSLGLVWTHLEFMACTAEVFWHELHAYIQRYIVVELLVVGLLDACRHFRVTLHLLACPLLEVCSDLVNLGCTCLCSLLVSNGLSGLAAAVAYTVSLADGDCLVLQGCFNKLAAKDELLHNLSTDTHSLVFFVLDVIRHLHVPCTSYVGKLCIYIGALLDVVLVKLWLYP